MLISLEGIDGSGKTTQAKLLAAELGEDAVLVREPGGTEISERIRDLLKDPGLGLEPLVELQLFCAARAQLIAEVIRPALDSGTDVVCDRFSDSSVAYQGAGRGLGIERVAALCEMLSGGLLPDLTLYLRVEPEAARVSREKGHRFEVDGVEFARAVADGYDQIAASAPERVRVIDARGSKKQVHSRVMEAVNQFRR